MSKSIICSMLLAAMLICTACSANGSETETTAETTGGDAVGIISEDVEALRSMTAASSKTVTASGAVAAYFFNDHYTAFTSSMTSLLEKKGFDENKSLGEQYYEEGKSWLGYFTDSMRTYMTHYMALCESAAINGVSLTDKELAALEARAARGVKGKYGENLSSEDVFEAMKLEALANKLTSVKKAELMPTESKMREYAEANTKSYSYPMNATVNVRHILFSADTYGSAEAALAKANEVMAQMNDVTAESFALLALEYSDDPSTCYIGGAYGNLAKGTSETDFDAWCFDEARNVGDIEIIETEHGAHIMYYEGTGLPEWQAEISAIMIDKEFNVICELLYKEYPVTFNEDTIAKIAE